MASAANKIDRSLPAWKQWVLAAYHGDVPLLKELLASGKVNAATAASEEIEMPRDAPWIDKGDTALVCACSTGKMDVIQWLLDEAKADVKARNVEYGRTALHYAADNGHSAVIDVLLRHGADINAKNKWGETELHSAAINGPSAAIDVLLRHGADINAKGRFGWTALHYAAGNGRSAAIDVLLRHGADINAKDKDGWTVLHYAASNGHSAAIDVLLRHGADINAKNKDGDRPNLNIDAILAEVAKGDDSTAKLAEFFMLLEFHGSGFAKERSVLKTSTLAPSSLDSLRKQMNDGIGESKHVLRLAGLPLNPWPSWLDLSKFAQLRHLDLSSCGLTEVPAAVQRASTLVALTLQDNPLTSLPEFILNGTSLPELQCLDVRRTDIVSLPVRLGKLSKLRLLYAGDSRYLTAHQAVHTKEPGALLRYLRELASDDSMQSLDRLRLMFLGPAGVGKSRLLECMLGKRGVPIVADKLNDRRDPTVYPVIKQHKRKFALAERKESMSCHIMFTDPPGEAILAPAVRYFVEAENSVFFIVLKAVDLEKRWTTDRASGMEPEAMRVAKSWLSYITDVVDSTAQSCRSVLIGTCRDLSEKQSTVDQDNKRLQQMCQQLQKQFPLANLRGEALFVNSLDRRAGGYDVVWLAAETAALELLQLQEVPKAIQACADFLERYSADPKAKKWMSKADFSHILQGLSDLARQSAFAALRKLGYIIVLTVKNQEQVGDSSAQEAVVLKPQWFAKAVSVVLAVPSRPLKEDSMARSQPAGVVTPLITDPKRPGYVSAKFFREQLQENAALEWSDDAKERDLEARDLTKLLLSIDAVFQDPSAPEVLDVDWKLDRSNAKGFSTVGFRFARKAQDMDGGSRHFPPGFIYLLPQTVVRLSRSSAMNIDFHKIHFRRFAVLLQVSATLEVLIEMDAHSSRLDFIAYYSKHDANATAWISGLAQIVCVALRGLLLKEQLVTARLSEDTIGDKLKALFDTVSSAGSAEQFCCCLHIPALDELSVSSLCPSCLMSLVSAHQLGSGGTGPRSVLWQSDRSGHPTTGLATGSTGVSFKCPTDHASHNLAASELCLRGQSQHQNPSESKNHVTPLPDLIPSPVNVPSAVSKPASSDASTTQPAFSLGGQARGFEYDLFISFAGADADREWASKLDDLIRSFGPKAFLDRREILPGAKGNEVISAAVANSKIGLLLLSPEYFERKWTTAEGQAFLDRHLANSVDIQNLQPCLVPIYWRWLPQDKRAAHIQRPEGRALAAKLNELNLQGFVQSPSPATVAAAAAAGIPAESTDADREASLPLVVFQALLRLVKTVGPEVIKPEFSQYIRADADVASRDKFAAICRAVLLKQQLGGFPQPDPEVIRLVFQNVFGLPASQLVVGAQGQSQHQHQDAVDQLMRIEQKIDAFGVVQHQGQQRMSQHFAALNATVFDLAEFPVPHHFIVLPREPSLKRRLLGQDTFSLHLICCFPGQFHLADAKPYKINKPKKFIVAVAPYLSKLLKLLQRAPLVGFAIPDEVCAFIQEVGQDPLQHYSDLEDAAESKQGAVQDVDGAALRALQAFLQDEALESERRSQQYQGLLRVQLEDGHISWMCDKHRHEYNHHHHQQQQQQPKQ